MTEDPQATEAARITSRFDANSTALEVARFADLNGMTAIVTGASSGIGTETARALATAGADVILAVRNVSAGRAAAVTINQQLGMERARVEQLDLASLASVRAFAAGWGARPLHILVNNAGVMATPFGRTADGFETQMGVNHLGHFLLARLLVPNLVAAAPSRVVVLSSGAHHICNVDLDDLNYEHRPYDPFRAYGESKTANNLFAVGFTRRFGDAGVFANAVMPGAVHTNLGRHITADMMRDAGWMDEKGGVPGMRFKSAAKGAATSVWAATAPELEGVGGLYLEDCQQAAPWSADNPLIGVKSYSLDPDTADRLWTLSERMTAAVDGKSAS